MTNSLGSSRSRSWIAIFSLALAACLGGVACSHSKDSADAGATGGGAQGKGSGAASGGAASGSNAANVDAASSSDAGDIDAGTARLSGLGPLRVGASKVPHAEMIAVVAPELKSEGIDVQVQTFEDYSLPNIAVVRGDLDANFFQTEPYLWRWRAAHGGELAVAGRVHIEPMGIWSSRVTNLDLVPNGGTVAVPSDPANLGRALILLKQSGLIDLNPNKGIDVLVGDITSNPHKLKFHLESAEKIKNFYDHDDLIVINGNYALEAKLPMEKAIFREDESSPFPNVIVTLEKNVKDPRVLALVAALRGPAARNYILTKYGGAVLPQP